jgi:uncharacterized linocin/CFP29 family protein
VNNLHRQLAPISDAAWAQIEDEARRTFKRNVAGRRVVDVAGPDGVTLAAVGTGHLLPIDVTADGVIAHAREVQPVVELRVPFTVSRAAIDDVERGSQDSDWQPVKDAARKIAFAEDRLVFDGSAAAAITGLLPSSSNAPVPLPADASEVPDAVARALTELRLAGVDGPYSLLLSADAYTAVAEATEKGYPILNHVARLLGEGEIVWAPALDGGALISRRGGDYELRLGQDLSIGYLSHDADNVELYLQESLAFLAFTAEASVPLPRA